MQMDILFSGQVHLSADSIQRYHPLILQVCKNILKQKGTKQTRQTCGPLSLLEFRISPRLANGSACVMESEKMYEYMLFISPASLNNRKIASQSTALENTTVALICVAPTYIVIE